MQSVFAQEHDKVFPITTTPASYTLTDNSFVDGNASSGIRLVFVAPKTGVFSVTFTTPSGADYYVYKCPSDAYTSCGSYIFEVWGTGSSKSTTISAAKGDSVFYMVGQYSSSYNSLPIEVSYEELQSYTVTVNGKDTSVLSGNYAVINASSLLSSTKAFLNWKIISGTGTFGDSLDISTYFYPSSDAELGVDTKAVSVYALTDKFKPYVYNANGYQKDGTGFAIRTSYAATDSGNYILFVKPENYSYGPNIFRFGTDSSFSSYTSQGCSYNTCRVLFSSNAGAKTYFELYQNYSAHYSDSVNVRVEKTIGVYAEPDTVGKGYAYVNGSLGSDFTHVKGDTVALSASANSGYKFNHWEKVSGKCTILDSANVSAKVIIDTECHVKAVFASGTVYSVTNKSKDYTTAEHYYSQYASSGVRFMFVAPSDGAYAISFKTKESTSFYYYKYSNSAFNSLISSLTFNSSVSDSVYLNKGDTAFYLVKNYSNYDSLKVFSAVYTTLKSHKITLTSKSTQCSTSVKSEYVPEGVARTYFGYSVSGYRPEGFKVTKGTATVTDSLPNSITVKVKEDITLQLQCDSANMIDITANEVYHSADKDFYEVDASSGIRYRYVAPTTSVYYIRAKTKSSGGSFFTGYYYNYGTDSTFSVIQTSLSISSSYLTQDFKVIPTKKGEKFFFKTYPSGSSYYDDLIAVYAIKGAFVDVEGKAYRDTVPIGNALPISIALDTGYNFVGWKLSYGSGTFTDSTAMSTNFFPSSDSAKVIASKKKGAIYTLTDQFSGYTYYANGTQTNLAYGVRTKYTPAATGTYVLITQSASTWYYYVTDSAFTTASDYNYCRTTLSDKRRSELRYPFSATAGSTYYFMLAPYSAYMNDSIYAKVVKIVKIDADTAGSGYVYVGGTSYNYDYSHVAGDTIAINAYANSGQRFDHWTKVSGRCSILDSSARFTKVVPTDDCKVKAIFRDGIIYPVTDKPTAYTTEKDYYEVGPSNGVRLKFIAPSTGTYVFVTSWTGNNNLRYYRYPDNTYYSYSTYKTFAGTNVDSLAMSAGDSVFFLVNPYSVLDSSLSFWISYVEPDKKAMITLTADSNGSVLPYNGYDPAWIGPKYSIRATADYGYRFDSWELVSGSASIDNKKDRSTLVVIKRQSEFKAHFRKGVVQKLSTTKKTYNYVTDYYSDATGSSIYFTWTPPDTSWYMMEITSSEKMAATWYEYGTDTTSLYSTSRGNVFSRIVSGNSLVYLFKGEAKKALYWEMLDSITGRIPDKEFSIQITNPYVLTVSTESKGIVRPSGEVGLFPGMDTVVTAISYGGYIFDKWVKVSGKVTIDDPTNTKTRVKPGSIASEIKATYSLDLATDPELYITKLDLTEFPGVCANVIFVDKNSQKFIGGLDSSDFVLFQDKKGLPIHVSSVGGVGGVSVAIVVDESGSMSWSSNGQIPIDLAKESIRQFIGEMTVIDRAAIVGFDGSSTTVHQTMTSDKNLLLAAVDRLSASGGTNILDGAYSGIRQIVDEMNSSAVIVFSDGDDGGNSVNLNQVIDYAKNSNTVIYSVAVGSDIKNPLKLMADGTGGTYTFAPSAEELAAVYLSIRNELQAKYTICYESPDTTINGDEHQVIIKTKFNNKPASDTAYWNESSMPPLVKLTKNTKKLIGVKQSAGDSIDIKVYVVSQDSIASVKLYMRTSTTDTSVTYVPYQMVHVKDSLWRYVVRGAPAVYPGLDFYVVATDASGMVGKTPQVSKPAKEPYTIPIGTDAPAIEYLETACVDTTSGEGTLMFEIKDDDGIYSARLYYRVRGAVEYKQKKLSRESKKSDDWTVTLPASAFRSDSIEFYVRSVDKKGVSARWEKFSNSFIAACNDSVPMIPDLPDTIWIKNGEKDTMQITRVTESIKLSLVTENFSPKKDSVTVSLACLVSGDVENNLKLMETRDGFYEMKNPMEKNEYSVKKNDGKISCAAADTMVATYKDPLYGTYARDTVILGDDISIAYQFMDAKCRNDLDSVQTSTSTNFCLKVFAPSPSLYIADTLKLTVFTDQGDSLRVEAVETDDYSKEYVYKGSFSFVEDSASLKDSLLDAVLDLDTTYNRVVIQGGTNSDKSKLRKRDSLVVYTKYVPADVAEIYDRDLDGKADSIRIHFKKALKKKIASIDTVYWNAAQGAWTDVDSKKIRIVDDSPWAEARVRKAFKYGLTAPDTSAPPYLRVTKEKSEFSQKAMLVDRVGAVPVKAVKRPGQISMEEYLDASDDVAPDTLEITMSESIKNTGKPSAWKDLFRYSKQCGDTTVYPIRTNLAPVVDSAGLVWKFVLADYAIMKDYCIMSNPKATYIDSEGNSMGRGGVKVEGRDETVYLYEVSAVQPVHGIGKKQKWIPQGGDSWEDVPDSLTVIKIASVAPYEANIYIYDNLANVVANMKQKFGYQGEMESKIRSNEKNRAKTGYLVWNHRSNEDRKVGTGVYIWRIDFKFKDGHTEYRILKTGYMRRDE